MSNEAGNTDGKKTLLLKSWGPRPSMKKNDPLVGVLHLIITFLAAAAGWDAILVWSHFQSPNNLSQLHKLLEMETRQYIG